MITVTQRNRKGTVQEIGTYTEEEFGKKFTVQDIDHSFSTSNIKVYAKDWYWPDSRIVGYSYHVFSKVAYNENGKILKPDTIVGIARKYWKKRNNNFTGAWTRKRGNGWKIGAYGSYRHMKTFQERKWAHAWDDEEHTPKVRCARNIRNLPTSWDDIWANSQKCWKKQSKRKHQWK